MNGQHIDSFMALFAVLGLTACGGGGSSGVSGTGSSTVPNSDARVTLAASPVPTPGFAPVAAAYVLLQPVSGRAVHGETQATPPKAGWALTFDEHGDFLGALRYPGSVPVHTAYELDVLAVPAPGGTAGTPEHFEIAQVGWTLSGGPQPLGQGFTAQPYAVHLASVAQLAPGAAIPFVPSSPSFFAWNSSGALLGAFNAPGRSPGQYTVPTGSPITVVDTTASWPESHCGNCWLVLQH